MAASILVPSQASSPAPAALRVPVRAFLLDMAAGTAVPLACYRLLRAQGASEMQALVGSCAYPFAAGAWSVLRKRRMNPFSLLVLFGLVVSGGALMLGGSPRVLLLRESLPTLALGLLSLGTLGCARPLMFYFARHMVAGQSPERVEQFTARAAEPAVRATHRRITAVWGVALTAEFCAKAAMVWALPTAEVLLLGPALFNATLLATMFWTVRYAKGRAAASQQA